MSAIFKEIYRGRGIYWHGTEGYGDETNPYGSLANARAHVDALLTAEETARADKFGCAALKGYRQGETARIEHRGAVVFVGSMREARRRVFDIEEQCGADIVWE